jgi:DNA polymerase-1
MKKLYLVDVSSMFFRAFYAIRQLTSPSGMPTNAIYGYFSMLIKLIKEENPDYIAVCYDRPEAGFRVKIDPNYKANRSETPEELIPQIPYIKKINEIMGIPAFEIPEYEADDVIATLTEYGVSSGLEVTIVSGDKDFSQLVRPHVLLLDTMKETLTDSQGVVAKWGVRPDQFLDFQALVGDSTDNIPGVKGIGPKGAAKLLNDFETLDNLYSQLDQIKSDTIREKLLVGKENAYLSKKLALIVRDIPMSLSLKDLQRKEPDRVQLQSLLQELNFKTFAKTLLGDTENSNSNLNESKIKETSKSVTFNIEIIEPDDLKKKIKPMGSSWGFQNERGFFISQGETVFQLSGDILEVGNILTELDLLWSGFDLKTFWRDLNIRNPRLEWDSMLAAYLISSSEVKDFRSTCEKYLHIQLHSLLTPAEELNVHLDLHEVLKKNSTAIECESVLRQIELPLEPILLKMEQVGIKIDIDLLSVQSKKLTSDIRELEKKIHESVGEVFNIASPKQLALILFEKMKIPPTKKNKTGYSTDSDVLEKLRASYPVIEFILEYRELSKLKSTYVDALPTLINTKTGRIHTHFNQALTTTGRLSSTNPNLQNIPIRTPRGAAIRKAFVAENGKKLISLDYSQIELRILAHITEDPGLCKAFIEDLDIHAATASEVFGVSLVNVTGEMRRAAKAVNFGIAYGQGAFGLSESLAISRKEAQEIINSYFTKFKGVKDYMENTVAEAKKIGFVHTLFGRRRIMSELKSSNPMIRKFGERAAINAPIQGSSSDIVKKAMILVAELKNANLILQVHDELLFEVDENSADSVMKSAKEIMENVVKLKVPLKVNGTIGNNWDEAH